jgi:drug/metabolite transporter (DMT)-like permease
VTAIALALGAALAWGVGDYLGGVGARRFSTLAVLAGSQIVGLTSVALVVAVQGRPPFGSAGFAFGLAAGIGGVVGLGALYRGLAIGAMSVVAPISAAAAAIPVVYGLARGERPSQLQLAGIAVALLGVFLAAREPGRAGRIASGVGLAVLAAVGFGWYFVAIDAATAADPLWAVLAARSASCTLAVVVTLRAGALRLPRAALPIVAAVGIFDVSANVMLVYALTHGYISIVSVVASLYPVATVALAYGLLGERIARAQTFGVVLALTGVALISAG